MKTINIILAVLCITIASAFYVAGEIKDMCFFGMFSIFCYISALNCDISNKLK